MSNNIYALKSSLTLAELFEALEIRLQRIKSLVAIRAVLPAIDGLIDADNIESGYWTTIEELVIQAEEIRNVIEDRVREQSMMESQRRESNLKGVEDTVVLS